MRTGSIVIKIQEEFFKQLEKQTNWERNQLMDLYLKCQNNVLADAINKIEEGEVKIPIRNEDKLSEENIINHNGMNSDSAPWED